jgi:hypothetical protein
MTLLPAESKNTLNINNNRWFLTASVIIPNLRILRLVRVERYANTLGIFRKVIVDKSSELLTSLSLMVSTIFIVATTIYYLVPDFLIFNKFYKERDLQPEKLSTLFDSTYFTVITLATIGN